MRDLDTAGRDEPYYFYGKLGYQANLNSYGPTNFAIDYGYFEDIAQDNDDAATIGLFAVQQIKEYGIDLYFGYRWHELDRTGTDYDDINALMIGSRIKF